MSKNSVFEQFELCYLKSNAARRAFEKKDEVALLMADKNFKKCVRYIAHSSFIKNKHKLIKHGFGLDDMMSVVQILGLQFVNHPFKGDTERDTSYIMMRFMNQRMMSFYTFLDRKFRIPESYPDMSLEDVGQWVNTLSHKTYVESAAVEDLDDLPEMAESKLERNSKLVKLRKAFNPSEHSDKLAELATLKAVEHAVRKRARSICRKHGIDYISWAHSQIAEKELDPVDFVLE